MWNIFNHMLVTLCIVDLLVILSNLVLALKNMNPTSNLFPQWLPYTDCLCHISTTASVFMTLSLTVERFYAVCSPHSYQHRVAMRGHYCILLSYIIPTIIATVILNIPRIMQLLDVLCSSENIHISINKFGIIFQVFHPLITSCIIPIFALSILNYRILLGSRRMSASSQNDVSMAKILMTVVTVFILLNIPRMILVLYEVTLIPNILECFRRRCKYHPTSKMWAADSIVRYLVLLNSSINFLIYCFVGSNFRRTLVESLAPLLKLCPITLNTAQPQHRSLSVVTTLQVSMHNIVNDDTEDGGTKQDDMVDSKLVKHHNDADREEINTSL